MEFMRGGFDVLCADLDVIWLKVRVRVGVRVRVRVRVRFKDVAEHQYAV